MARDIRQSERFKELEKQADELDIEGLFAPTGEGLTPEEMANKLWQLGCIKIPTVEELLAAIKREVDKRSAKKQ